MSNNGSNRTEIVLGANVFPATFGCKGSAIFRAEEVNATGDNFGMVVSAKNAGAGFRNYATYAPDGITFSTEGLTNGLATYKETITVSISRLIDISKYEYVSIFPNASGIVGLAFTSTPALPIKDGKRVVILNTNNSQSLYLYGIIRGATSGYNLAGGAAITIIYDGGFWYGLGVHDNNW